MGVAIPLGYVEDRASGALVVDGSLRFAQSNTQYLTRTPSSNGDRTRWTVSLWCKRHSLGGGSGGLRSIIHTDAGSQETILAFWSDDAIFFWDYNSAYTTQLKTVGVAFRDVSSWYHIVLSVDTTQSTDTERIKLYVNNVRQIFTNVAPHGYIAQNTQTRWNSALISKISGEYYKNDCSITNIYNIDGQALDASYFGYTDALTNTWRPKKLSSSVAFGTNGFYLPFDGSAPIGQDQSGRGNNWTPVNFGGSNTLEKATGALPILNTDGGGKVARVGVRTDSSASSLVLALPLVGIKSDFSNAVNSGTSNKATTVTTSSFSSADSIFYGGSLSMASGYVTVTDSSDFNFGTGSYTVECWVNVTSGGAAGSGFIGKWYAGSQGTTNGWLLYRGTNGSLYFVISADGINGTDYTTAASTVPTNKWVHCAACYDASTTTLRLFVDGVVQKTQSSPNTPATVSRNVTIGRWDIGDGTWSGYIQDVRIYKGLAKYTQNFIPASTDPDILPDTPSGVSYTSNLTQITDGAVAFDGSGDYLSLASSSDLTFGTGDFTLEYFINTKDTDFNFMHPASSSGSGYWGHIIQSSSFNWNDAYATTNLWGVSGAPILDGRWHHCAICRASGVTKVFFDGVSQSATSGTFTDNTNYSGVDGWEIGGSGNLSDFLGFISNLHVVKGTALYTSNFTPPTGPISSVANTKLLCCKSNASAGAATSSPNISGSINNGTVWSSTTNTSLIYGGSASMIFDGNATWSVGNYANFNPGAFTLFSGANVTANTSIRVYGNFSSSDNFKINGTTYTDNASGSNQWIVPSGVTYPITVNSIVIDTTPSGLQNTISAVEIDGTILTDPVIVYGNAAATNFNPFTVNINTQRGKQSGWCTWNRLEPTVGTLSNGNLLMVGSSAWKSTKGTVSVSSGKWYYEGVVQGNTYGTATGNLGGGIGWYTTKNLSFNVDASTSSLYANLLGFHNTGQYNNFSTIQTSTGSMTAGDVIGVALNKDSNTFAFYKNGVSIVSGSLANTTDDLTPWTNAYYSSDSTWVCNFGQKPFKFPPPAGFQPLALANTPRPTIVRPDQFVGVTTYTGTGAARSINTGFKPDLVWVKKRGSTSDRNVITDSVRGANLTLNSDDARSEASATEAGQITAFNGNGFSLGTNSNVTGNGDTFVAWAWKAGGNSNTYNINDVGYATASAAGLTAGTITPTGASVNTKSGFSIITYTGTNANATISHGLGNVPAFIIAKSRDTSSWNWIVYHKDIGVSDYLALESTQGSDTRFANIWGSGHTTSVFGVRTGYSNNPNGERMVAYCWAEIPGFSKFGSYAGNQSADGPTIITGFRPRWIMIKSTSSSTNWRIIDTERSKYNPGQEWLFPNSSSAEPAAERPVDILSNGFKIRVADGGDINYSSSSLTYIYAAFAETPTQNLYGAQANAR